VSELLRLYGADELGREGYPFAWDRCPHCGGSGVRTSEDLGGPGTQSFCPVCQGAGSIKDLIRELADHRCIRCGHPYRKGEHGNGEWSPCDSNCDHAGPVRVMEIGGQWVEYDDAPGPIAALGGLLVREAQWRILTVHHLTGSWGNHQIAKRDCRWWNLASLCQKCHLLIQGKVRMERRWLHEHAEWFKPYVEDDPLLVEVKIADWWRLLVAVGRMDAEYLRGLPAHVRPSAEFIAALDAGGKTDG